MVDARVGADESVARFGDQHMIAADDAPRLPQDDFDGTRIFIQATGEHEGFRGRLYACQPNESAFRL